MPMPISNNDTTLSNETPITTDFSNAVNEGKQPLPYNQSGVSVNDVTANGPKPQSKAAFFARGGITNTINEMRNNAVKEQREAAIKQGYEKLLQGNTKAADAVYQAYSKRIQDMGGNPEDWIPPKELFYDPQTGYFLPHKYYEAVYVGAKKFEEDKLNRDKLSREEADKAAKIKSNQAFGQDIANNPQMTKQEGMASALQKGTVTPEMIQATNALSDPTKNSAKKLDLDWAKLKRQINADRLREMQIVLTQEQNRNEAARKSGEKIAQAEKDLNGENGPIKRKKDLQILYNKAIRGEPVRTEINGVDIKVSAEDLFEMIEQAEQLVKDTQAAIEDMNTTRKKALGSDARLNLMDGADEITKKYQQPEPVSQPKPKPVIKPSLSISPKPVNPVRGGGF